MPVYKYDLPEPGLSGILEYRRGARPVHVAKQDGEFKLWSEVLDQSEVRMTKVYCIGTGWDIPKGASHVGTILDGPFVWHFYIEDEADA